MMWHVFVWCLMHWHLFHHVASAVPIGGTAHCGVAGTLVKC